MVSTTQWLSRNVCKMQRWQLWIPSCLYHILAYILSDFFDLSWYLVVSQCLFTYSRTQSNIGIHLESCFLATWWIRMQHFSLLAAFLVSSSVTTILCMFSIQCGPQDVKKSLKTSENSCLCKSFLNTHSKLFQNIHIQCTISCPRYTSGSRSFLSHW